MEADCFHRLRLRLRLTPSQLGGGLRGAAPPRPAPPRGSRSPRGGAGYPQETFAGWGGCGLKALGAGCGAGYPQVLRGGCRAGMVKVRAQYLVRQPATPFHKLTSLS